MDEPFHVTETTNAPTGLWGWSACHKYKDASTSLLACVDWAKSTFHPDSTVMQCVKCESPESEVIDVDGRPDTTSDLHEPWMSFEPSPDAWRRVLIDEFNCDRTSVQEIFCLAQHSEEGWKGANSIIAKLLKKKSDGDPLHNPSAFVHSCARNTRNGLMP